MQHRLFSLLCGCCCCCDSADITRHHYCINDGRSYNAPGAQRHHHYVYSLLRAMWSRTVSA